MHSWIGGVLWVGPTDSAHEAESWWFTEGFAHYMTVRLLARFELLDANDVRDDLEGQVSTAALSPFRDEPNARLAAHAQDDGVHALLAARGALYAAHLNETIRAASHGARFIDGFVQGLFEVAKSLKRALNEADWEQTLRTEVAPEEVDAFSRFVLGGQPVVLADGALGRCFHTVPRVYARFDSRFRRGPHARVSRWRHRRPPLSGASGPHPTRFTCGTCNQIGSLSGSLPSSAPSSGGVLALPFDTRLRLRSTNCDDTPSSFKSTRAMRRSEEVGRTTS